MIGTQLVGRTRPSSISIWTYCEKKVPHALPPEATVIEILKDVAAEEPVVQLCRELKEAGYTLALDDFTPGKNAQALVDLADIIKVDFRLTSPAERADIVKSHRGKISGFSRRRWRRRRSSFKRNKWGISIFRAIFSASRTSCRPRTSPATRPTTCACSRKSTSQGLASSLEHTIKRSTYLTYALLNYINSAHFSLRRSVGSIMEALELLGEHEVRRWASLAILTFIGADKPSEVNMASLVRAKFCESLAMKTDLADEASELFMTGMFSMLDVLVGRPIERNPGKDKRSAGHPGRTHLR